jgi:hypothetical protein
LLQEDETRRAQLRAGAEALAVWVRARRDSWPELPADVAPRPGLTSLDAIAAHSAVSASLESAVLYASTAVVAEPVLEAAEPASPRVRFQFPTETLRSVGAPVLRWSFRAAALAALVAVAVGAVRLARPYVTDLLTAPTTGTVVFESLPSASEVLVDGALIGRSPLTTELPPGSHVVEFRQKNATRKMQIDVRAGQQTVSRLDWSVAPTGRLTVRSDPAGARILVDGRERGVTPLTLDDLTIGAHTVVLQTAQGSVGRTVKITADQAALVSESIYVGWLKLFAPFEVQVAEGTRAIRLDEQNQIMLSPGPHELRFESRALGYRETHRVNIEPGKTMSLSLVPAPSILTVTSATPAVVLIDGLQVGETPLTDYQVALGTRDIVVRSAAGQERRYTRRVTVAPMRIDVDFSQP